jgi:XTP/dITP diphosphohydrolase
MSGFTKIVLASNNQGKLKEFVALMAPLGIEVFSQSEFGIEGADETGLSFIENAILKARHAAKISELPAMADDSGICVDALQGAPGIYSARYAGEHANDTQNNLKLLDALKEVPDSQRGAQFRCALALVRSYDDPIPIICEGIWQGNILRQPQGSHGFGYDPLFFINEFGQTSAELEAEVKNRHSHRAKALARLIDQINTG